MEQKKESSEEDMESISMKEPKEIKRTKIGNKEYDEDTMNRITTSRNETRGNKKNIECFQIIAMEMGPL